MAAKKKVAAPRASKKPSPAKGDQSAPDPESSQFYTPEGGPWGKCFLPRPPGERRYWLVKSEPDVFSWNDLLQSPGRTTCWDGVRNFAARNFLRDAMRKGDLVFFYHSMTDAQHIAGICEVVREAYPDPTAFDKRHEGYDPKSSSQAPTWYMVDLRAVAPLREPVTLAMLKANKALKQMALLRIGRLSVTPVSSSEWNAITTMGRA